MRKNEQLCSKVLLRLSDVCIRFCTYIIHVNNLRIVSVLRPWVAAVGTRPRMIGVPFSFGVPYFSIVYRNSILDDAMSSLHFQASGTFSQFVHGT